MREQMSFKRNSLERLERKNGPLAKRRPLEYQTYLKDSGIIDKEFFPESLSIDQLQEVLVPDHASSEKTDSGYIFTLNSGGKIKVETDKDSIVDSINFFYGNYGGKIDEEIVANRFISILEGQESLDLVFKKNDYYQQEQEVQERINSSRRAVDIPQIEESDVAENFRDGVLLVPDMHGDMERHNFATSIIDSGKIDWFAMEMLPHKKQEAVDAFINMPEDSREYDDAKQELLLYYSKNWEDKHGDISSPEENPYFQILKSCKKNKIQVKAMDVDSNYYRKNLRSNDLVIGTRNLAWANQVPENGNGIVFGGRAHFEMDAGINVQDFLVDKRKDISIVKFKD